MSPDAQNKSDRIAEAGMLTRTIAQLRQEIRILRDDNLSLQAQLAGLKSGEASARESRRAALNLMEDAVMSRRAVQMEVIERRHAEDLLKVADRRKDEFLATLAHELRNPLAPIRNGLGLLRMTDSSDTSEPIHRMLERQVAHMVRLVDDLMEVSRITRGDFKLRLEEVDLAGVVNTAVETSRPLIEAGHHHLAVDLPPESVTLQLDPMRISQVITNLLNNAAKYTASGGDVSVSAHHDATSVEISVRDTGLGIPAEMMPRVFDLFTQVDRTLGRAQGGLGIGLTLVRRLVEAHGGTVEGKSKGLGFGSEFIVRLPVRHKAAA